MTNLWDLIEQIRDPDGWRERKAKSLGLDIYKGNANGEANIPIGQTRNSFYRDYPKLDQLHNYMGADPLGQIAPDKWPKDFWKQGPYKGML